MHIKSVWTIDIIHKWKNRNLWCIFLIGVLEIWKFLESVFPYDNKWRNQYSVLIGTKIQRNANEYYWLRAWYTAVDYDMHCRPDPSVYKENQRINYIWNEHK